MADIERCLEITEIGSYGRLRAFINLASTVGELGELTRSAELHEEGLREAERFGGGGLGAVRWLRAERIWDEYLTGRWNEAVAHADEFIADVEGGQPHYMEAAVWAVRAMIRLGRGDGPGALADSERALALGRATQDPQTLYPTLAFQSQTLLALGRRAEAVDVVDELLALLPSRRSGFVSHWTITLAVVLTALGRPGELAALVEKATVSTRWLDAARAYGAGEFVEAADIHAEIGARSDEAFARLRAAEALVDAGRRADADAQLRQALAFYRSVGATAYVREGEGLLPPRLRSEVASCSSRREKGSGRIRALVPGAPRKTAEFGALLPAPSERPHTIATCSSTASSAPRPRRSSSSSSSASPLRG